MGVGTSLRLSADVSARAARLGARVKIRGGYALINLEEPVRVRPAQPGLIRFSVCPSVCLSVRAKRGIE